MNDQYINPYDLNKITKFLLENRVIVAHWLKGKGLKFTYSTIHSHKKLPLKQQNLFKSGYFNEFMETRPRSMDAFERSLGAYTEIMPVTFKPGAGIAGKNKHIIIYTAGIKKDNPHLVTIGAYFKDQKGKNVTSYIMTNRDWFKAHENRTEDHTYQHELGHHFGLRDTDKSILDGQLFDLKIYTIMSYCGTIINGLGLFDILTLHANYGASYFHNTGDDIYTMNYANRSVIWDAGGIDTLVLDTYNAIIDMRDGEVGSHRREDNIYKQAYDMSVAFGCNLENATITTGKTLLFLNALDNVVNFQEASYGNIFYITDTHVETKIDHTNKKPIEQKIIRSKVANGKVYQGWGHDVLKYSNDNESHYSKEFVILDVQDASSFEFYSYHDHLVITHKSKALDGSGKIYTSSLTVEKHKYRDKEIVFLVRARNFKQWKNVKETYKIHNDSAKNTILKKDIYKRLYLADAEDFTKKLSEHKKEAVIEAKIASYDTRLRFISNLPENRKNKALDFYREDSKTIDYVPLTIEWKNIVNKKINPQTLKTKSISNGVIHQALGDTCSYPAMKKFYVGELIRKEKFNKIRDHISYTLRIEWYDEKSNYHVDTKKLIGRDIKMFMVNGQKSGQSINITIFSDNRIIQNLSVNFDKNNRKKEIIANNIRVYNVLGTKLKASDVLGKNILDISDANNKDGLKIQKERGRFIPYNTWQDKKINPEKFTLVMNKSGFGTVTTKTRFGNHQSNTILFTPAQ